MGESQRPSRQGVRRPVRSGHHVPDPHRVERLRAEGVYDDTRSQVWTYNQQDLDRFGRWTRRDSPAGRDDYRVWQEDDWAAWDILYKPTIDRNIDWIDGIHEHHYQGDTTAMNGSYEVLSAYGMTEHNKWLYSYNTETNDLVDAPARGAIAEPEAAPVPLWHRITSAVLQAVLAGAILMAARVTRPAQPSFGVLDITVERNAYGRQLDSVQAAAAGYPVSFIRAPRIAAVHGAGIEILATRDGDPTWLRAGRHMATTFHPELTLSFPSPMHRAFVELVERHRAERDAA